MWGLPHRIQDSPDPIKNLYAVWVREALEVAYDQVRCHAGQAVRRQKCLHNKRALRLVFAISDWTRYYPPAKKCKLDSPWLEPYLVVSFSGWAVGVQLHPDSLILMIHCQDLKKIPVLVVMCRGCNPSTVSGILSQQSLPQAPDTGVTVLPPKGSICVDSSHGLHPFFWEPL